jgi:hypothetical protein
MSPRRRKEIDPATLKGRFGLHFRNLMEISGKTVPELVLHLAVVDEMPVTDSAVRKWMRGEAYPPPEMMVCLARFFGLSDYRHVLPPPAKDRDGKRG